jgi:nicotinamide-nucleotide amidase
MDDQQQLAEQVSAAAQRQRLSVAVAESLTGGLVSSRLAAATQASNWFRGAIVAYASEVKHELLSVPAGPVVSAAAAEAMAAGVAALLGADVAVSLTGVGGPEPQDDQPPGTVWIGLDLRGRRQSHLKIVDGDDPTAICACACTEALRLLAAELHGEHA